MRKNILILFLSLPILLFAQMNISFASGEIMQFTIGMKKSDAEKILQKIASKQGINFNMEDYRILNLDDTNKPRYIRQYAKDIKAYRYGENKELIFYRDSLSLIFIRSSYLYNTENKAKAGFEELKTNLNKTLGESYFRKELTIWLDEYKAVATGIIKSNINSTYAIMQQSIRRDWLSKSDINEIISQPAQQGDQIDEVSVIVEEPHTIETETHQHKGR